MKKGFIQWFICLIKRDINFFTDYGIIAKNNDRTGFSLYDFDGSFLNKIEGEDNSI